MKIIVIGCGRAGSGLAMDLSQRGHAVTVIDSDAASFDLLGPSFKGRTVVGWGFDRDVLMEANIDKMDGLAAVTASDETNAVIARLASQFFRVPRVVARLYDPRKEALYQRLGIQTVDPTFWGINRTRELLLYSPLDTVWSLGDGGVDIVDVEIPVLLVGRQVRELTVSGEFIVIAISRCGKTILPTLGTLFQEHDLVHLSVVTTSTSRLKTLLGLA